MREERISRSEETPPGLEIFDPRKGWLPGFTSSSKASSSRNKAKVWFQEGRAEKDIATRWQRHTLDNVFLR